MWRIIAEDRFNEEGEVKSRVYFVEELKYGRLRGWRWKRWTHIHCVGAEDRYTCDTEFSSLHRARKAIFNVMKGNLRQDRRSSEEERWDARDIADLGEMIGREDG